MSVSSRKPIRRYYNKAQVWYLHENKQYGGRNNGKLAITVASSEAAAAAAAAVARRQWWRGGSGGAVAATVQQLVSKSCAHRSIPGNLTRYHLSPGPHERCQRTPQTNYPAPYPVRTPSPSPVHTPTRSPSVSPTPSCSPLSSL